MTSNQKGLIDPQFLTGTSIAEAALNSPRRGYAPAPGAANPAPKCRLQEVLEALHDSACNLSGAAGGFINQLQPILMDPVEDKVKAEEDYVASPADPQVIRSLIDIMDILESTKRALVDASKRSVISC
jgi:hypothetical protein